VKVSVAMATYNGGPYLAAQLASLRRQDRLPDELVISDDGSVDETEQIAKDFAATAPFPVIWLRNPGRPGYHRNFDYALSATIGDVVLLADQDDVWLEQHVSRLTAPFADNAKLMVTVGDSQQMDATGYVPGETMRQNEGLTPARLRATNLARGRAQFRAVLSRRAVIGHNLALRRQVLEIASPLPSAWRHDHWIFLIGAAMGEVLYVDEVISRFREYSRQVPGQEYPRGPSDSIGGPFLGATAKLGRSNPGASTELIRWQNLQTRLTYSRSLLPEPGGIIQDVARKARLISFRTAVRRRPVSLRAVRALPWRLAGRYRR